MKGNAKLIEALNQVLTTELTAINQYLAQEEQCERWGFRRLAEAHESAVQSKRKHSEELVERILFLEGTADLQKLGKVKPGKTVAEQLKLDHGVETETVRLLNSIIAQAVEAGDNGTRDLLAHIVKDAEEQVNWIEAQLTLVEQVGEQNYLAQQIHK